MLFWSDKAESNGPKVEAKVRKEFGVQAPIPYQVEIHGQFRPQSLGQFAGDIAGDAIFEIFGAGGVKPLYTFDFRVQTSRPCNLKVPVIKAGNAIVLGSLVYATPLAKPIFGEIVLEDEKVFGNSKFVGDPAASEKLNANKDLVKRVNKFARAEYKMSNQTIKAKRIVRISSHASPQGPMSVLTITTQPRATWFGMGSSFDAQEFLAIAGTVEQLL
ncbi:hypothetical protein [Pendulispora albinea]|uniref:Uncharacterized protein n=1 Tax=Pendulispora albinea TaxID=2741071 RepID=A0ABZ2LPA1_9BACT